jgi:tetratricopeptide (TPR) repeat protein
MSQQSLTAAQAQQLQQAHQLMQQGRADDGLRLVDIVLAAAPKQVDALHLKALILHQAQQFSEAEQIFKRTTRLAPADASLLGSYANLLGDMKKWQAAFNIYATLTKSNPQDATAWMNWGITALSAKQHGIALEKLARALALAPKAAVLHCTLGDIYRDMGDMVEAEAAYRNALLLNENLARAHVNIALVLRENERGHDALRHYDKARRLGFAADLVDLGEAFARADMDDIAGAVEKFTSVITRTPENIEAQTGLAKLQWKHGLIANPLDHLEVQLAQQPGNTALWAATLKLAGEARLYAQMLPLLARAEHVMGSTAEILEARAVALSETGDLPAAQTLFESLQKTCGLSPKQLALYARHSLRHGAPQTAANACEQALAVQADLLIAQSYLGTAWRLLGDAREYWLHDYARHVMPVMLEATAGNDDIATVLADIKSTLTKLHSAKRAPLEQSLRGGTQTSGQLLNRHEPDIVALRQMLERAITAAIATLPVDTSHPFLKHRPADPAQWRFNGSWSVQLSAQGFHVNHMHSHGWLSSACYIALPEAIDDGTQGWIQFGSPPVELGLDLPPRRVIKPEPGLLVLFPSSMWHGTLPFAGLDKRMTVAFDVVAR